TARRSAGWWNAMPPRRAAWRAPCWATPTTPTMRPRTGCCRRSPSSTSTTRGAPSAPGCCASWPTPPPTAAGGAPSGAPKRSTPRSRRAVPGRTSAPSGGPWPSGCDRRWRSCPNGGGSRWCCSTSRATRTRRSAPSSASPRGRCAPRCSTRGAGCGRCSPTGRRTTDEGGSAVRPPARSPARGRAAPRARRGRRRGVRGPCARGRRRRPAGELGHGARPLGPPRPRGRHARRARGGLRDRPRRPARLRRAPLRGRNPPHPAGPAARGGRRPRFGRGELTGRAHGESLPGMGCGVARRHLRGRHRRGRGRPGGVDPARRRGAPARARPHDGRAGRGAAARPGSARHRARRPRAALRRAHRRLGLGQAAFRLDPRPHGLRGGPPLEPRPGGEVPRPCDPVSASKRGRPGGTEAMRGWRRLAAGALWAAARLGAQQPPPATLAVTLDEAVRRALEVQPAVIQARGDQRNAAATERAAVGAFLPAVTAGASSNNPSANRSNSVTVPTSTTYSGALGVSLDLFDGFRRLAARSAAAATARAADAGFVNQRYQVSVNKFQVGAATRSDTLTSAVDFGNAQLALLQAQANLATAQANLGRQIGVDQPVRAVPDTVLPPLPDTTGLRAEALAAAPQVRQADAAARAARAQVTV